MLNTTTIGFKEARSKKIKNYVDGVAQNSLDLACKI